MTVARLAGRAAGVPRAPGLSFVGSVLVRGVDMPTRFLPGQALVVRANRSTDKPAPSLRPDYQGFTATTSRSAGGYRDGTQRLRVPPYGALPLAPGAFRRLSGGVGIRLPTFDAEAADRARAASMPDTSWPVDGSRQAHPGPI
jgi:hypothetical protein